MKVSMKRATGVLEVLLCVLLLASSGCAYMGSIGKPKPTTEDLTAAVAKFNDAMRWGVFKAAAAFVPPVSRDAFWTDADALRDHVRVMEYEVRNITVIESAGTGEVNLECRFYGMSDPRLQYMTLHQRWLYNWGTLAWQVVQPDWSLLLTKSR